MDNIGDDISLSTCILYRKYEAASGYKNVEPQDFTVVEGVWDKASNAKTTNDVPSICKRIIASKVVYEEFMGVAYE